MAEEKSGALEGGTPTPGHFEKLAPLANYPCRAVAGPPGPVPLIAIGVEMGALLVPEPQSVAGMPITAAFSCNPCAKSGTLCSSPRIAAAMPW